ncbi:MAG: AAA family ATPase [Candidatus Moranbacteria bacterium]|nr:AAA family ATPase [Candidatus Moranbacteria bacterium]
MTDIIGHARQRAFLRKLTEGGLSHHAFLLSGPEGIGKRLVALEFAASLLGLSGGDPVGRQDFLFLSPVAKKEGGKRSHSVESIREVATFLSRFPAESARRVVMIDDADRMTESAQNALLKTLEEPSSTAVIILVATRIGALRDTVVSRTFRVPMSVVPEAEIREAVPEAGVEQFFYALGRPGIVVSATADPEAFAKRRERLRSLFHISSLPFSERIDLSEELASSPVQTAELFEWWVTGLRNTRREDAFSPRRAVGLYGILDEIERTIRAIRDTNGNARLLIDRLFLTVL